ncbi:DUF2007 domain-containing protein [uncultured Polaribacter sp.]|uniref:putative signal transducing protein n=1 Tax=uncultured Polaribacter sp. TaxID=174711 RepID=UPI002633BB99|nr:DUF2007 domain-containing protein [uncultured Polaribacter sp.]
MRLITIKESNNETEISILKGKLESEGVQCYLKNEFIAQLMPNVSTVQLQLSEKDMVVAKEIMSSIG